MCLRFLTIGAYVGVFILGIIIRVVLDAEDHGSVPSLFNNTDSGTIANSWNSTNAVSEDSWNNTSGIMELNL